MLFFFLFFFLSRKVCFQSACHMPQPWSHLTVIRQNDCWTQLTLMIQSGAQEYRNQLLHLHVDRATGTPSRTAFSGDVSLAESWARAEKINSNTRSRERGSVGSPNADRLGSCYVAIFSKEKGITRSRRYRWSRRCQEQDKVQICYRKEDEPQKSHTFLISSLPDTWLNNSAVHRAALTSTFCMICKTDFFVELTFIIKCIEVFYLKKKLCSELHLPLIIFFKEVTCRFSVQICATLDKSNLQIFLAP